MAPVLMRMIGATTGLLLVALVPRVVAQGSAADYARAKKVHTLRPKLGAATDVRVAWSANEEFVVYLKAGKLVRLDLRTAKETPATDMAMVAQTIGAPRAEISLINFALAEKDALLLLIKSKKSLHVLKHQPGSKMIAVALEADHPFVQLPTSIKNARTSKGRGGMTTYFLNRSGVTVKRYWVTRSGERKPYGTIAADAVPVAQGTGDGHAWVFTDENDRALCAFVANKDKPVIVVKESPPPEIKKKAQDAWQSPTGKYRAFIRDHNVFLREVKTKKEVQLSNDGTKDNHYVGPHWSPDGNKLIMSQVKDGQSHTVHVVESTPKDQLQPKLHSFNYLKPGDRKSQKKPRLFDIATLSQITVKDDRLDNPWAITRHHWSPDGKEFFFVYNQRGHQIVRLLAIDATTGQVRTVVEETSKTFVDYVYKTWCHHLDDTDEVIWMSERNGWNHLYLVDRKTGAVKNRITKGNWVVRAVQAVDTEKRQLLLKVLGVYDGQDPYYVHYARVNFDGSGFTLLTEGDGTHDIDFSPKGQFFIDTYSRVDLAPVKELRRVADGALLKELSRVDMAKVTASGWKPPERFVAKGRDGRTDIHGLIFRPTNVDPKKTYPVIESIYAGPHGQHVPKSFGRGHLRPMTELGFVIVQIDGMGTNWRSKAFHDVCWKNLADAGFPDRKAWIRAAAKKYPYLDMDRVGIYGGSAGGQNAMRALIDHNDFYKAAVADCGCHDNRMDKIWWNEFWMGWPIDKEAYDRSSNAVQAHKMKGRLMLTVGELDRNVDPASTMQVVDALIKADKDFDLIVFPGQGHGAGGSPYGRRRMWDFFVRHLHGKEPRH